MHEHSNIIPRKSANRTIPSCHRCKQADGVHLRYNICANGAEQYFWYCLRCECITPIGRFIPHDVIETFNLPAEFKTRALLNDYREHTDSRCCVCGAAGVELHHFAPRSLAAHFGDEWHNWPTAYLCVTHHRLWHEIVTPLMPGYRHTPLAQEILDGYMGVVGI